MLQTAIFVLRDPETGMFWSGKCPGTFEKNWRDGMYWYSRNAAMSSFSDYIEYTAARVTNTSPSELELVEFEVIHSEKTFDQVSPKTHPKSCIKAIFDRRYRKSMTGVSSRAGRATLDRMLNQNVPLTCIYRLYRYDQEKMRQIESDMKVVVGEYAKWIGVSSFLDAIKVRSILAEDISHCFDLLPVLEEAKETYGCVWEPNEKLKSQQA